MRSLNTDKSIFNFFQSFGILPRVENRCDVNGIVVLPVNYLVFSTNQIAVNVLSVFQKLFSLAYFRIFDEDFGACEDFVNKLKRPILGGI